MAENEYRDGEKVLYQTRGKLSLPHKEPEEVDCFVTEGHVVIEAEEPIKIPVSLIRVCDRSIPEYHLAYSGERTEPLYDTVTLVFLDELDKKRKLLLTMRPGYGLYFKREIDNLIPPVYIRTVFKEWDSKQIVILPTIMEKLGGKRFVWLVIIICIALTVVNPTLGIVGWFVAALHFTGNIIGKRVIIDKLTETITAKNRYLMLIQKKRVIPFSKVRGVRIDEKHVGKHVTSANGAVDVFWEVSIDTSGKKIRIDRTSKFTDMRYLANEISRFIGSRLIDNSENP